MPQGCASWLRRACVARLGLAADQGHSGVDEPSGNGHANAELKEVARQGSAAAPAMPERPWPPAGCWVRKTTRMAPMTATCFSTYQGFHLDLPDL